MRTRSAFRFCYSNLLCLALAYSFLFSTFAPFAIRKVGAAPDARRLKATAPSKPPKKKGGHRAGDLLVRFRENATEEDKRILVESQGARRDKSLRGGSRVEKLKLREGENVEALAAVLRANPAVELVEPNYLIGQDETTPNDTRFAEQWGLRNTGATGGQPGADINATLAWARSTGAQTTTVAVIDSGVDFSHPDLINNRWINSRERANGRDDDRNELTDDLHGWDWIAQSGTIRDEQGHGTIVAGIIAAQGNNGTGISGVMWRASLMSLRVLDNTGTGDIADAVEAIDYAVAHGAQVINCSWGTDEESLILRDAIDRAGSRGVVVVTSAGNDGRDIDATPYYPASFNLPNLIAVASSDQLDQLAPSSNYGARSVAIAAPGVDVLTTQMGGGYRSVTGTSASAPFVSGVAGLVKSVRPWLSAASVSAVIKEGARRVDGLSGKVSAGGVLNAAGALGFLRGPDTPPPGWENGNGSGNNGNGNGNNGNGQGNQMPRAPQPGRGNEGNDRDGGFSTTPPQVTSGAPSAGLPNLDEIRQLQSSVPTPPTPIRSNLPCADCDLGGGGGGGSAPPNDTNFSTARTLPQNETGQSGVDLGSRNVNWGIPILGLKGRAGLALSLSLVYNSLVWTKDGTMIKYNADHGFPGPGFRLGFPYIQPRYLNSQTGIWAYMMLMPSGERVELRQVGSSNIYEAQDGSYTQMTDNGTTAVVRTMDGTQYSFTASVNSEMRCNKIKDRNGNYITIGYDSYGHITTITDTLARVINFNYDADHNLQTIWQEWKRDTLSGLVTETHTWATFSYGSLLIQPNFPGFTINGPNNQYQTVLTRVALSGGSYYDFSYNSWGQVRAITKYSSDAIQRSYTSYNLPQDSSSPLSDCPKFSEERVWAKGWNNDLEAVTSYSADVNGTWGQMTTPDGTVYKEFYGSGWQKGLTVQTEVRSGGLLKKWTTITWTQDNTSATYPINPRPTDIYIYDGQSTRRTRIEYTSYSLPSDIYEYAANATTVLRRTHVDYRFDSAYINNRIIGLPMWRTVYDENGALAAKTWFDYDWGSHMEATGATPTQHDSTNYGAGSVQGRGNLCLVLRYDITDPNNAAGKGTEFKYGYNQTGSVTFTRDDQWHQQFFYYDDSFSDGVNRNTYAYLTKARDEDGYDSFVKYNYTMGVVTRTEGPPPAGQTQGAVRTVVYDSVGRVDRSTNQVNSAYQRFVYGPNYVQTFSTVESGTYEDYAVRYFDGAGRMINAAQAHPSSGGGGGYSALDIKYDVMGRVWKQSKPTDINGSWVPAGDDAAGWVYTTQTYDWKGRPTLTTNPDGSTTEATYGGCGCAGGDTVTLRDERGRRRKLTMDVLGRLKQVEELNWNQTVYSTTTYTYNVLDQIKQISQAGQTPRTFEYDGLGRIWRRTTPEQGITTCTYNRDDTINTITDARGATQTFSYNNNRHLVTGITYAGAGGAPSVTFGYDAAGNRTSMTDGHGQTTYAYNRLSQLTSETRTFSALGGASFTLSYQYNLGGALKKITGPWGEQITYGRDHTGGVTGITSSGYGGVSTYASNLQYRAFGGLRAMTYGNSKQLSVGYDNRMRVSSWNVSGILGWNYSYNDFSENSGRVTFAQNLNDSTLNRSYDYDQVGRLIAAYSGLAASAHTGRGGSWTGDGPYAQAYQYDVWGNRTHIEGWGGVGRLEDSTYTNNRRNGIQYDAAGNLVDGNWFTYSYNAAGQQIQAACPGYVLTMGYDGDGLRIKKNDNGTQTYYLHSTVLGGQVVAEINASSQMQRGYVYLGLQLIAIQEQNTVTWVHQDPVVKSQRLTNSAGAVVSTVELDPYGADTNRSSNELKQPRRFTTYERDGLGADDAVMRRYNRWWGTFDQPDPWDGSYKTSDPQTLNRYSYVESDPVNKVDPTGLFSVICVWGYSPEYGFVGGDCFGGGGSTGYEPPDKPTPNGPGEPPPPPEPPAKSDCENFVDALIIAASKTPLRQVNLGRMMGADVLAANRAGRFNNRSVTGFKEVFIREQGGYVYAHIQGMAGAYLIGDNKLTPGGSQTGWDRIMAQINEDHGQLSTAIENKDDRRVREGITELMDDVAGIQVGNIMEKVIKGQQSAQDAKKEIFNLLCDN